MRRAMLPGSFDPPTMGHINIIERAASLFDELYVVIADNISKKCLFTPEERRAMIIESLPVVSNMKVEIFQGLTVDFAAKHDIDVIVRGVRAMNDFSYEFELAMTNKMLNPNVDVIFIPTDPQYFLIRSSQIKEIPFCCNAPAKPLFAFGRASASRLNVFKPYLFISFAARCLLAAAKVSRIMLSPVA